MYQPEMFFINLLIVGGAYGLTRGFHFFNAVCLCVHRDVSICAILIEDIYVNLLNEFR